MRTKIIAAAGIVGLLAGAGVFVSVIASPGTAQAQEETDDTKTHRSLGRAIGFLEDVLHELVDDETLTRDQADTVIDAVEAKANEVIEEHLETLRQRLRDNDEHLEGLRERLKDKFDDERRLFPGRFRFGPQWGSDD